MGVISCFGLDIFLQTVFQSYASGNKVKGDVYLNHIVCAHPLSLFVYLFLQSTVCGC